MDFRSEWKGFRRKLTNLDRSSRGNLNGCRPRLPDIATDKAVGRGSQIYISPTAVLYFRFIELLSASDFATFERKRGRQEFGSGNSATGRYHRV